MESQVRDLIEKLEKIRIGVCGVESLSFLHHGAKLTAEMITMLKTDEDVIELAKRLLDGLIPNTEWEREAESLIACEDLDEYMDEMIEERKEMEDLYRLHTNPTQKEIDEGEADHSSDENGPELDHYTVHNELCDELGLSGSWSTLNGFLREVGYPEFKDDYPFELDALIEIWESDLNNDVDQYCLFLSGEMDQGMESNFNGIMSSLLGYCGDNREEYEEDEVDFLEQEQESEAEEDVETFRDMINDSFTYLNTDFITPEELKTMTDLNANVEAMDIEELKEFYDEIEYEIEKQEEREEEQREELMVKVRLIEQDLDEDLHIDVRSENFDEIEDWIEEHKDKLDGKKIHKRPRDYFDEQDILSRCKQNDPNSAIEEIRYEQSKTDLCIDPLTFKRLCQEVVQDFIEREDYDFEPGFYEALQVASEDYLIRHFESANLEALHAGRTHIQSRDMRISEHVTDKKL